MAALEIHPGQWVADGKTIRPWNKLQSSKDILDRMRRPFAPNVQEDYDQFETFATLHTYATDLTGIFQAEQLGEVEQREFVHGKWRTILVPDYVKLELSQHVKQFLTTKPTMKESNEKEKPSTSRMARKFERLLNSSSDKENLKEQSDINVVLILRDALSNLVKNCHDKGIDNRATQEAVAVLSLSDSVHPSAPTEATEVESQPLYRKQLSVYLYPKWVEVTSEEAKQYIGKDYKFYEKYVPVEQSQHTAKELAEKDKRIKYLEEALQDIADSIDCIHEGNGDIKQEALNAISNPNNLK